MTACDCLVAVQVCQQQCQRSCQGAKVHKPAARGILHNGTEGMVSGQHLTAGRHASCLAVVVSVLRSAAQHVRQVQHVQKVEMDNLALCFYEVAHRLCGVHPVM